MKLKSRILATALAVLSSSAALAYPPCGTVAAPVDVAATAGRWTVLDFGTGVLARGRTWPRADGSALVNPDPRYCYLLDSRVEPPDYDSRLQALECVETPDPEHNAAPTVCTAPLLPAASLLAEVRAETNRRVLAIQAQFPVDLLRAQAMQIAMDRGDTLSGADAAWYQSWGDLLIGYVAGVTARGDALELWIEQHPGQSPAIDQGWPALPAQ